MPADARGRAGEIKFKGPYPERAVAAVGGKRRHGTFGIIGVISRSRRVSFSAASAAIALGDGDHMAAGCAGTAGGLSCAMTARTLPEEAGGRGWN